MSEEPAHIFSLIVTIFNTSRGLKFNAIKITLVYVIIFVEIPDLFLIYFYSSLMFLTPNLLAFVLMMWFVCSSSAVLTLLPNAAV